MQTEDLLLDSACKYSVFVQVDADKHCKKAKFEKGKVQQCLRRHRMVGSLALLITLEHTNRWKLWEHPVHPGSEFAHAGSSSRLLLSKFPQWACTEGDNATLTMYRRWTGVAGCSCSGSPWKMRTTSASRHSCSSSAFATRSGCAGAAALSLSCRAHAALDSRRQQHATQHPSGLSCLKHIV